MNTCRRHVRASACLAWLMALGSLVLLTGCREELQTYYGQRKGAFSRSSVNGTAVFSEMFEHQGHTVFSWSSLSPKLQKQAEVIVWFPDDFQPPSATVRTWLEAWLRAAPHRTLIYVGRDFDAAPWYWASARPQAPASQSSEFLSEETLARSRFNLQRGTSPKSEDCGWFTLEGQATPRPVRTLQGQPEWLGDVDPSKLAIELHGRLVPPEHAEVLLRSEKDVLVSRQILVPDRRISVEMTDGERLYLPEDMETDEERESQAEDASQLIVVSNGSFLLNAMLVNHEHRKLASQLIAEVGPPSKTVVFLESHAGGPPIRKDDLLPSMATGMEVFHIWPTNWILLHLSIVGILFCFSRYVIFGRPRQPAPEARSDFGQHIEALAEMLERSGDTAYAYGRLMQYRQLKAEGGRRKQEPGTSPAESPTAAEPPGPDPNP